MALALCYSALSPFCRKVRMAMDHKQLTFESIEVDSLQDVPVWNPRAEVPVLVHGDTVVCHSPDILAYLDRCYPERPVYPPDGRRYAEVRRWERLADTQLDAIATVVGNWSLADLPPMPAGLMEAARRDIAILYDQLQGQLAKRAFICGEISAADFAAYPHVAAGSALGLPLAPRRHPDLQRWLQVMRTRPEGQIDNAIVREWPTRRRPGSTDARRVNWGTFRLEWLLANGQVAWFADQVRQGRVLWSTGPENNAFNSPVAPRGAP